VVKEVVIAQLTNKRRSRLYSIAEEQKGDSGIYRLRPIYLRRPGLRRRGLFNAVN
jgi:hypothetical protein